MERKEREANYKATSSRIDAKIQAQGGPASEEEGPSISFEARPLLDVNRTDLGTMNSEQGR